MPLLTHEARQKQREAVRRPENRTRHAQLRAEANRTLIKPTKLEKKLETLLEKEFPGEWEYTGDGKVIIDGMIPDFFNKNGRKMVIEAFGRYWHEGKKARTWRRTELGRIMAYNALGIKCLVIWEEELKNEPELTAKIKTFVTAKSKMIYFGGLAALGKL